MSSEQFDLSGDGGVQKQLLVEGTGDKTPPKNSKVSVHYTGTLLDGTKFDSSVDRGTPFEFTLGQGSVIKAWDLGVATMKQGEKCILTCAPEYAYGKNGSPPKIPADATLKFEVELLSWNDMENVTSDGAVKKRMIVSGPSTDYSKPNDYAVCDISYELFYNGQSAISKTNYSLQVSLDTTVCDGMEDIVKSLKAGEKCEVEIAPSFAFGSEGAPSLGIPPHATLTGWVELHSFTKGTDKWAMKKDEKVDWAEKRKNIGNVYFKENRLQSGVKAYKGALSHIEYEKDLSENAKELLVTIHSNLAAIYLKETKYADARKSCDSALKQDPKHVKSLFRRAQSHMGLAAPDEAIVDLTKALEIEPSNPAVKSLLAHAKRIVKAQVQKERTTFGGIFEKLSKVNEKEIKKSSASSEERVDVETNEGSPDVSERMETDASTVSADA